MTASGTAVSAAGASARRIPLARRAILLASAAGFGAGAGDLVISDRAENDRQDGRDGDAGDQADDAEYQ